MEFKIKDKQTLCLNMIVKNESEIIVNTLEKLTAKVPFDYWVIADTGSTDNTIELIENFFKEKSIPGEIFKDVWEDFGTNRTKALEYAYNKTDFLLVFDADDEIYGDFKLPTKYEYDSYNLIFGNESFKYNRMALVSNRKKWRYVGVLHEVIVAKEPVSTDNLFGNYYVISGRTSHRNKDPKKYYHDALVLKKGFEKEIDNDPGLACRYAFYCGQSYKDAGVEYIDEAIEWYKKCLNLNNWTQEKYYACLMIGDMYSYKKDYDNATEYWLKASEYDQERIEGVVNAMSYYRNSGKNILVNVLYNRFKNYNKDPHDKLFLYRDKYKDEIEYNNSISAFYVNEKNSGYLCCKQILINKKINLESLKMTLGNIMFYKEILLNDEDTLDLFYSVDDLIATFVKHAIIPIESAFTELWLILFKKNRINLTQDKAYNFVNRQNPEIFISFTTCKRVDLFKETINSILRHWSDVDKIDYWFCVDDNSSIEDRSFMLKNYGWIDYYMKNEKEKGHRKSMNIIWNKLNELKPKYWIHMEDDFLFHTNLNYISHAVEGLKLLENRNVKQMLFNLNYAEIIDDYGAKGHVVLQENSNYALHHYKKEPEPHNYVNHHYWPNYSFRPSIVEVDAILKIGNFDTPNQFFEMDYANKWTDAGFKSAFFNRIVCRHIGRLTKEMQSSNVLNAYQLNQENQFVNHVMHQENETNSIVMKEPDTEIEQENPPTRIEIVEADEPEKDIPIKVINLERRVDRKDDCIKKFNEVGINSFEFIKAIDGNALEPTLEIKRLFDGNDFGNRRGVIGCALSHYYLWNQLILDEENDYYIVMEDDFTLSSKFKDALHLFKEECMENEFIFFGYHMYEKERLEHSNIYDNNDSNKIILEKLNKDLYVGGTFSYSINKLGAKKIIDYIKLNGIKHGIDYLIKICPEVSCSEFHPLLVSSFWNENGAQIDSDIQNIYIGMNFENVFDEEYDNAQKEFIFVQGKDQMNGDLYYNKQSIFQSMKLALKDKNCLGFNTLGFFKNKIDEINESPYFTKNDGIYIKIEHYKNTFQLTEEKEEEGNIKLTIDNIDKAIKNEKVRIKMLCNWCSSEELCKEWSNMCEYKYQWKNIEITWEDTDIDYYVIINYPQPNNYYDPSKTIIMQMEPFVDDKSKNWGTKTWGKWANPDENEFLHVLTHKKCLNNVQWLIKSPLTELNNNFTCNKQNIMSVICSNKNLDEGHILRNKFIRFIEEKVYYRQIIHTYGKENYHNCKSYIGQLKDEDKFNGMVNYKYHFACENNSEINYATEKIWDSILSETLCFYWGCPNLEEYIDPRAFVRLDLNDFEGSLRTIKDAIFEDWWSQRIDVIRREKNKILNDFGFFPNLKKMLNI